MSGSARLYCGNACPKFLIRPEKYASRKEDRSISRSFSVTNVSFVTVSKMGFESVKISMVIGWFKLY